jgi:hypothetical protein
MALDGAGRTEAFESGGNVVIPQPAVVEPLKV